MAFTYFDFFAGGGMAGVGLGPRWNCGFANDIDPKKALSYRANHHGGRELHVKSVIEVDSSELPGQPIWFGLLFLVRIYRLRAMVLGCRAKEAACSNHIGI